MNNLKVILSTVAGLLWQYECPQQITHSHHAPLHNATVTKVGLNHKTEVEGTRYCHCSGSCTSIATHIHRHNITAN